MGRELQGCDIEHHEKYENSDGQPIELLIFHGTLWIAELRSNLLKSTSSEQDSVTCIENWLSEEGDSRGNNGEEGKSHKGESEKESYSGSLNLGGGVCLTSRNSASFDGFLMINERL